MWVLVGGTGTLLGFRALFRHQYVLLGLRKIVPVPTIVPTLAFIWLFAAGLFGFIRDGQKKAGQIK